MANETRCQLFATPELATSSQSPSAWLHSVMATGALNRRNNIGGGNPRCGPGKAVTALGATLGNQQPCPHQHFERFTHRRMAVVVKKSVASEVFLGHLFFRLYDGDLEFPLWVE